MEVTSLIYVDRLLFCVETTLRKGIPVWADTPEETQLLDTFIEDRMRKLKQLLGGKRNGDKNTGKAGSEAGNGAGSGHE
jgi:hypothetical protein